MHVDWFIDFPNKELRGNIKLTLRVSGILPVCIVTLDCKGLHIAAVYNNHRSAHY